MSKNGNISVKQKDAYKKEFSKAEVRFARQFGYEKAMHLQGIWHRVSSPKAKNFEDSSKRAGYTDYIINSFISAKRDSK